MAHRLDWLAVFIIAFGVAFRAIVSLWSPDGAAFAAGMIATYGLGGSLAIVVGFVLFTALGWPALGWLIGRLLFSGQYRLIKAGCLLLCGIGVFALTRAGLPFLPMFDVVVLVLFITTWRTQYT
jgi:hypothetical protein